VYCYPLNSPRLQESRAVRAVTEILDAYLCDCNRNDGVGWETHVSPISVVLHAKPVLLPTLRHMFAVRSVSLAGTEAQILPETACSSVKILETATLTQAHMTSHATKHLTESVHLCLLVLCTL